MMFGVKGETFCHPPVFINMLLEHTIGFLTCIGETDKGTLDDRTIG